MFLLFPVNSRLAAGEILDTEPGACPVVKGTMMSVLKRLLIERPLKVKVGNLEKKGQQRTSTRVLKHSCIYRNYKYSYHYPRLTCDL